MRTYLTTISGTAATFTKQHNKLTLCLHTHNSKEYDTEQLLQLNNLPENTKQAILKAKAYFSVSYI